MPQAQPLVSVIIPTFNRADCIGDTLGSILGQTLKEWEAVVVDDGSEDGTFEYLMAWANSDPRIRVARRERQPKGGATCRNIGLSLARGEFVQFLDSDDLLGAHCLETRIRVMGSHREADFCVGQCLIFNERPGDLGRKLNGENGEDDLDRFLKRDNPWDIAGPLWRRTFLGERPFDEALPSFQDWQLHVGALLRTPRYIKMAINDHHYRSHLPRNGCISHNSRTMAHLREQGALFMSVGRRLHDSGQLNEKRRHLIAGLVFYVASSLARQGETSAALDLWGQAARLCGLAGRRCLEASLFLRLAHVRFVRYGFLRYLECVWPSQLFGRQSVTLGNAEVSPADVVDFPVIVPLKKVS